MKVHIFNQFASKARYKETDSGKMFIFSNLGRITETDNPDIYDVWLVGPFLNAVSSKKLAVLAGELQHIVYDLVLLDGEATGNCCKKDVAKAADILQIPRKGKNRGVDLKRREKTANLDVV